MVVDTCCQELRERERVADQAWFSQWQSENSDHHRQIDLEERCLLALINHHFRKTIAVFSSFLPPSLPFFLFVYSKILNCNSTQNIYNCSLSFFKYVNAFGSQIFWATILLQTASQMEPICESYERDQTCTHTKQAPFFCPRKTRLRRLEPLEFSITVKRGFQ